MTKTNKELLYDFFTHPMRIFFLYAGILVLFGVMILLFQIGNFIHLHQFIFIDLFCGCAFAGFLFSAIPDWTNYKKSLLPFSIVAFILLNFALLTELLALNGRIFILLFWLWILGSCIFWLYKGKNTNHLNLIFVLLCLVFLQSFGLFFTPKPYALIHCYVAGIIVIGFRVSTVLAQTALDKIKGENSCVFIPNPILRNLSYFAILMLALCNTLSLSQTLQGFITLGAGLILLSRIYEWHYKVFLKVHYTLIYYFLLLGNGIFYVLLGINDLFNFTYSSTFLHGITLFVLIGFIYLVFNVASLRHSGQIVLNFPLNSKIGFLLLALATLAKVFLWQKWDLFYINFPAVLLSVVFIAFLRDFFIIYRDIDFSDDPK